MTINVLLTGGRAPATLDLARQLAASGCQVYIAESARYHLCRVSRAVAKSFHVPAPSQEPQAYISALQAIIGEYSIDWLIPTCEEVMYVSQGLEQLTSCCRVLAAPFGLMVRLHHKYSFIRLAEQHGFMVPGTRLIRCREDWENLRKTWSSGPFILKPAYSRFASQVKLFDPSKDNWETQWQAWAAQYSCSGKNGTFSSDGSSSRSGGAHHPCNGSSTDSLPAEWVAQQFIIGRQLCTYSVAHNGRLTAHAAYYTTYRAGIGASIYFSPVRHEPAQAWVEKFAAGIQFNGQISFDFIETADGKLYPIECNPRATSGIHLFAGTSGLTSALLQPGQVAVPAVPPLSRHAMLSAGMLSYGIWQDCSWNGLKQWWRKFRQAKDVVYSSADRKPLWEQLRVLYETRRTSRRERISMLAATTFDIEWNGENDCDLRKY